MDGSKLLPEEWITELASRADLTPDQARRFAQAQAEMIYSRAANNGCPIPGVGVVRIDVTPEKVVEHKFGPEAGKKVLIPPRHKLIFRFTEAGKGALMGHGNAKPNVFNVDWYPEEEADI